jgi:hypothetical protein
MKQHRAQRLAGAAGDEPAIMLPRAVSARVEP